MQSLISFPVVSSLLEEYDSLTELERSCRTLGCDGLEMIWGGEDFPTDLPDSLKKGYHLTFYPDWLDFWREDEKTLLRKFGTKDAWVSFYGGESHETLMQKYRDDLKRATSLGAQYVVFHVSDVSLEEGYTYKWEHTDEEVLDASADIINALLEGSDWDGFFLVENQWWPGFTFTEPQKTKRLLNAIRYPKKGIMLDIGHLMNTDCSINTEAEGVALIHRMLNRHGDICGMIRGIHLHQSLSGSYVKANTGRLPADFSGDYITRFTKSYGHILKIDTHSPWTEPSIWSVIERISPDFLVHELSYKNRAHREERIRVQAETLQRGGGQCLSLKEALV